MKIILKHKLWITTTITVVVILFVGSSCKKEKAEIIAAVENRKEIPRLKTDDVTILISDSGVTQARVEAPVWYDYDKADTPYWEFNEGIHLERFGFDLTVEADIKANYAKYFSELELWELRGNVDAINLEGERFQTERLFWDRKKEQIYSDTLVKITQKNNIIYGVKFESDQTLSKYTIEQGTGDFLIPND